MNEVVDYINVNRDRYIEELKALLAIPSISALPEHRDLAADRAITGEPEEVDTLHGRPTVASGRHGPPPVVGTTGGPDPGRARATGAR